MNNYGLYYYDDDDENYPDVEYMKELDRRIADLIYEEGF